MTTSSPAELLRSTRSFEKSYRDALEQQKLPITHQTVQRLRTTLCSLYRRIIVQDTDFAVDKGVIQAVWPLFYHFIHAYRKNSQQQQQAAAANDSNHNQSHHGNYLSTGERLALRAHIDEAVGYFKSLEKLLEQRNEEHIRFRCLIFLGDLARYRELCYDLSAAKDKKRQAFEVKRRLFEVSKWYYKNAIEIQPGNGNPYNQLAVISTALMDDLGAIYYYCRSLHSQVPFGQARENLSMIVSLIRQNTAKEMARAPPSSSSTDMNEGTIALRKFFAIWITVVEKALLGGDVAAAHSYDTTLICNFRAKLCSLLQESALYERLLFKVVVVCLSVLHDKPSNQYARGMFETLLDLAWNVAGDLQCVRLLVGYLWGLVDGHSYRLPGGLLIRGPTKVPRKEHPSEGPELEEDRELVGYLPLEKLCGTVSDMKARPAPGQLSADTVKALRLNSIQRMAAELVARKQRILVNTAVPLSPPRSMETGREEHNWAEGRMEVSSVEDGVRGDSDDMEDEDDDEDPEEVIMFKGRGNPKPIGASRSALDAVQTNLRISLSSTPSVFHNHAPGPLPSHTHCAGMDSLGATPPLPGGGNACAPNGQSKQREGPYGRGKPQITGHIPGSKNSKYGANFPGVTAYPPLQLKLKHDQQGNGYHHVESRPETLISGARLPVGDHYRGPGLSPSGGVLAVTGDQRWKNLGLIISPESPVWAFNDRDWESVKRNHVR